MAVLMPDTIGIRYNAIQWNLFHTALHWLWYYINWSLHSQKTPPYLALTGELWYVSVVVLHKFEFALAKDTPYLALTGELWYVSVVKMFGKLTLL